MDSKGLLSRVRTDNPQWVSSEDSIIDVATTTLVGPISLLLREVLCYHIKTSSVLKSCCIDCLCILLPVILAVTVFHSSVLQMVTVVCILTVCMLGSKIVSNPPGSALYPLAGQGVPYLDAYRAQVNLIFKSM